MLTNADGFNFIRLQTYDKGYTHPTEIPPLAGWLCSKDKQLTEETTKPVAIKCAACPAVKATAAPTVVTDAAAAACACTCSVDAASGSISSVITTK
jgi:hypothetical protein